ncbi:hypothetical protein QE152_g16070 [Popillia japonica]|uniref:Uncharacterized protein n=1 Tax=Popillia japonica TaxID=7064 RepID=A0AAW1L7D9_POPJA
MSDLSDEEPFSADSSDNTEIQCSKSTNILILDSFVIQKSSAIPNLDEAVPVYDGKLPLKSLDSFVIQKSSAIPNLDEAVPVYDGKLPLKNLDEAVPVYDGKLPLKSLKYENAMRLAKKYVPANDNWYYQQLISEGLPKTIRRIAKN